MKFVWKINLLLILFLLNACGVRESEIGFLEGPYGDELARQGYIFQKQYLCE